MSTSPKGIQSVNFVELQLNETDEMGDKGTKEAKGTKAVDHTIAERRDDDQAAALDHWLAINEPDPEAVEREISSLDSRATAEAIMKRLVPDLYQALVDVGDIKE